VYGCQAHHPVHAQSRYGNMMGGAAMAHETGTPLRLVLTATSM